MANWIERYWDKVEVRGADECWEWTAAQDGHGYGAVGIGGKVFKAHRVSWKLAYGPIPEGLCVLHHCDNRHCVNPNHLWLGTRADNNRDMADKGRVARGARQGSAKLTRGGVWNIRQLYSSGDHSHRSLAARFGVSHQQIGHIVNSQHWSWLDVDGPRQQLQRGR